MASGCQLKISGGSEFKVQEFWLFNFGFMESLRFSFLTMRRSKYFELR